jgi:membrane associated rhomboid family serine protease
VPEQRTGPLRRIEVIVVLAVIIGVFVYQVTLGPAEVAFAFEYGAIPTRLASAWASFREQGMSPEVLRALRTLVTANFLHADIKHIAMNGLFYWVFGNAVAQVAGRVLFPVIFLLAGCVAVVVHARVAAGSDIPMVGASGAIAGLEGAYFVFALRWRPPNVEVWPLAGPVAPTRLAFAALVFFALDTQALFGRVRDTVAYGAHVGGFLGGAFVALTIASLWKGPKRPASRV